MPDKLPPLTHLQFLVLAALRENEQPGRVIRKELARFGAGRTAAAFYQTMARLEQAGLVQGWYEQITVGDQAVSERRYRLTATGARFWNQTYAFYQRAAAKRSRESNA
jgi:DNA-binding PadR family transcriptional regulator